MILISVVSEVMHVKRQFESDIHAERYLKRVKVIHDLQRMQRLGYFGKYDKNNVMVKWNGKIVRTRSLARLKRDFARELKTCIPLRISIINTEANQLNLIFP